MNIRLRECPKIEMLVFSSLAEHSFNGLKTLKIKKVVLHLIVPGGDIAELDFNQHDEVHVSSFTLFCARFALLRINLRQKRRAHNSDIDILLI